MNWVRQVAAACCLLAFVGVTSVNVAMAQDYTIEASDESGLNGTSVTVSVTIDNIMPIRGFSFGLGHDSAIATLTAIDQGSVVAATNVDMMTMMAQGADFIFTDLMPVGGPGGIYGVVISTEAPIEEIPSGAAQEIAQLSYDLIGPAGSSTNLAFSSMMGSPPVATVLSVAGVSHVPVQTSGSVSVDVPPVTGLMCGAPDPCTCEVMVSWSNPIAYDLVTVTVDGMTATTTTGTSATVTLAMGATSDICVYGTVSGVDSTDECCQVTCPMLPPSDPPTNLMCSVDMMTCDATITWTNAATYSALELTVAGVPQALASTDEMAIVNLTPNTSTEICVVATDGCGNVLAAVCCTVECSTGTGFVRGDCNADASYNIADAVFALNFLFSMGMTPVCLDACDCNDDGAVNIADAVCKLNGLFGTMTVPPAAPHPGCGLDPTDMDGLTCLSFPPC